MANACNHLKVKDIPKNADGDLAKDLPSLFQSRSSKVEMPRLGEETSCSRGGVIMWRFVARTWGGLGQRTCLRKTFWGRKVFLRRKF